MITEKEITLALQKELEPLPYVYAFWIEGSFAMGYADDYSDIDYWIDVEDDMAKEAIRHVEAALQTLGELDERDETDNGHPKLGQIVYHLRDSSPYLVLDFNWQLHSRNRNEYAYIKEDIVEGAKVLFDKDEIVRFVDADPQTAEKNKLQFKGECDYRYSQHARVKKYILRGDYLEATAYYNRYVIEPLLILLRLKYTPRYPDYHLLHISRHIPKVDAKRLEKLIRVSNLPDMNEAMGEAEEWYQSLHEELHL